MQERIFTLKKGTEVPDRFDGVTVPFQVPASLDEARKVCEGDESRLVAIFNQAYALNLQKSVKDECNEDGATVDSIRAHAAAYKPGQVKSRKADPNKPRSFSAKKSDVEKEMFAEFLRNNPEAAKAYQEKVASLKATAATAAASAPAAATAAPAAPAATTTKKK